MYDINVKYSIKTHTDTHTHTLAQQFFKLKLMAIFSHQNPCMYIITLHCIVQTPFLCKYDAVQLFKRILDGEKARAHTQWERKKGKIKSCVRCVCESQQKKTESVSYTNGAKWENSPSMLWQIMPIYNGRGKNYWNNNIENQVLEHIWITPYK